MGADWSTVSTIIQARIVALNLDNFADPTDAHQAEPVTDDRQVEQARPS
jgi:hypothetical protein